MLSAMKNERGMVEQDIEESNWLANMAEASASVQMVVENMPAPVGVQVVTEFPL